MSEQADAQVEGSVEGGVEGRAGAQWTALALSRDVEPGTAVPVMLHGRELVVWRSVGGRVQVWDDRCPHRGMRLSFGFVRGETLACLYHGWRFGTDAGCTSIPAHPELEPPKTICASAWPCLEAGGLVFTAAADAPPPCLPAATMPVRSLTVHAPATVIRAALARAGDEVAPGLFSLTPTGQPAIAAVQPVDADRTALHVLVEGTADIAERIAVAEWTESIRRIIEAGEEEWEPW